MDVRFLLNGETVELSGVAPTATLLDWLRETRGLTGTKEGCNEGDCGACTVMVGGRALNACILFLPQLDGQVVQTVEGACEPDGTLHPVQQAMVDHHGSQCGFCTPGFVMSMVAAHRDGATDTEDRLAGNLCRCTGYAPILRAADAAATTTTVAALPRHRRPNLKVLQMAHFRVDVAQVVLRQVEHCEMLHAEKLPRKHAEAHSWLVGRGAGRGKRP